MTQVNNGDKLYVITRQDLVAGYQGVQAMHAAIQFGFEHLDIYTEWYNNSNYLAFLATKDETSLTDLIKQAEEHSIRYSVFREPDVDNAITAIALEPGEKTKRLCARLPLALRK